MLQELLPNNSDGNRGMRTGTTAAWADWCCDALPVEVLEFCLVGNGESSGTMAVQGQCGRAGWVQDKGKSPWEERVWISELVEKRALSRNHSSLCCHGSAAVMISPSNRGGTLKAWEAKGVRPASPKAVLHLQRWTRSIPLVSLSLADKQHTHSSDSALQAWEERIALQHGAAAFVPAHQGTILTHSMSISNVLLILFCLFFPITHLEDIRCLFYTWGTDMEDRSASTINVLNLCTSCRPGSCREEAWPAGSTHLFEHSEGITSQVLSPRQQSAASSLIWDGSGVKSVSKFLVMLPSCTSCHSSSGNEGNLSQRQKRPIW